VKSEEEVDVFQFRDYRAYLREVYSRRKASEYGFSYRAFARKAGLGAPNYLKLVSDGERNLTPEMARRFATALGLGRDAGHYFCDLVAFNQAASAPERQRCYERLSSYRRYRRTFRLDAAHAAYHAEWYIPAIRELAACRGFRDDPQWIAHQLRPRISTQKARAALEVLERLGLLVRSEDGRLRQSEPLVSTGDDKPLGHHIASFHRAMLKRASDAIDEVPREEREIGALTLGVSAARFERIKRRLFELRQELLQESADEGDADRVVQVNFQLFPLSYDEKENEEA
jgi:uncharacterized protein (TIGR02147 family)